MADHVERLGVVDDGRFVPAELDPNAPNEPAPDGRMVAP
jgi:hypothetical protein